jgi:hypothetical protein
MKNKHYSLLSVIAIACAVGVPLSLTTAHELPVQAALTPPSTFDYFYAYTGSNWAVGDFYNEFGNSVYTRTSDSTYFNYTTTINNSLYFDIPDGLEITMTFNRSNTSWSSTTGGYIPTDTKIGSNNTVGSVLNKVQLIFENNTINDYQIYIDTSSSTDSNWLYYLNSIPYGTGASSTVFTIYNQQQLSRFIIPSGFIFELNNSTTASSSARYFDAWYLKDLGVSASYEAGYDDGYDVGEADGYQDGLTNNPNLLINAAQSFIGMFVNFIFIIFTLDIFGVSILSIVGILFGIITIVWILKTIKGG